MNSSSSGNGSHAGQRGLLTRAATGLLALTLMAATGLAQARFEPVGRSGDWMFFRDNTARLFDTFSTPLVMGTLDTGGAGALVVQCRPNSDVFAPTRYSVSGGFLFLNFAPTTQGLISTPWYTSAVLQVDDSEYHTPQVNQLPFVSGFLLEKLAADTDALYDEAQTIVAIPRWLFGNLESQMRQGERLNARLFDFEGRRVQLSFSLDGFGAGLDDLRTTCNRLNDYRPH